METKVNYVLVGLFVIILTIAGIVGGFWLSVGLPSEHQHYYLVYMDESVSGLSVNAPVKYNGVDVGFIRKIDIPKKQPNKVRLLIQVSDATPVTQATRAILDAQGLTGLAYLELTGGAADSPPLIKHHGEEYPIIASKPSLLFRLDKALDNMSHNVQNITGSVTSVLSEENADLIHKTLVNVERFSHDLQRNSGNLDKLFKNADVTLQNAARASEKLPAVMASIERSAQSIDDLSDNLAQAGEQVRLTLRNGEIAVQTLNDQVLPQAINSLGDFQHMMNNMKNITEQLDENPAILIRGKQPSQRGPGESR